MALKQMIIWLCTSLLVLALIILVVMLSAPLLGLQAGSILGFTQNFQNLAMPIVTCISVIFLYASIRENTKQAEEHVRQNKIARLDELLNGQLESFEALKRERLPKVPYAIKYALSDSGADDEMDDKLWDVGHVILQVDAFLSLEKQLGQSNIKAAMHDYLSTYCSVNGICVSYLFSDIVDDIASLVRQRNMLEVDKNKNQHLFNKLSGVGAYLTYTNELSDKSLETMSSLEYLHKGLNFTRSNTTHAESPSVYYDRVSKLEKLSANDILTLTDKAEVLERLKELLKVSGNVESVAA